VGPLILASRSPQRRAILEQLGIDFTATIPDVEEVVAGSPAEIVLENARRKASAGAAVAAPRGSNSEGTVVLGVDTVVALGETVYGKPADRDEAESTLRALSGVVHQVLSGVCLADGRGTPARTAVATTAVSFRSLDEPTLAWYLDSGEWRERAGGYAIQGRGAALVAAIEGDYLNVVGLPVATLLELQPRLLPGH